MADKNGDFVHGEVNFRQNTTINIWLNDGVYYQWKNYMFRPKHVVFPLLINTII